GLPLGGKVHKGPLYLEAPATAEPPPAQDIVERAVDTFIAETRPNAAIAASADEDFLASLGSTAPRSPTWCHCRWTQAGECRARSMTTQIRRAASTPTITTATPVTLAATASTG